METSTKILAQSSQEVPDISSLNKPEQSIESKSLHSSRPGRRWLGLTLAVGLFYLAFLPPGIYSTDGNGMLAVAESVVSHGSIEVPAELGMQGRGGHFFGIWYPLQSLIAVPFVAVAAETARLLGLPAHYLAAILSLMLPALFTAVTTMLVGLIAERLGSSSAGAFLAAISYAFGTMAMAYARTFYAEPLLTLLTAASLYFALAGSPRQILFAGALALLAVLAKPTGILVGLCITGYLLFRKLPLRWSAFPAIGSLVGLLLYCGYNQFRFGHPLTFGQPWAFDLLGAPKGFAGLLLSPGRGLIWYCPPIVLAAVALPRVRRTNPHGGTLMLAIFAAFLALHAAWSFWPGGWSWGPRLLLPALPGVAALLALIEGMWRRVLLTLACAGFLINAPTLFTFYERYYAEANEQGVSEQDLVWSFSRAPFLHSWGAAKRQVQNARAVDIKELLSQRSAGPATSIASSRALRIVAVWWWVLPVANIPRWVGACIATLMIATACALLLRHGPRWFAASAHARAHPGIAGIDA